MTTTEPGTTITLYGIPSCGTVKKARGWLDSRGIRYHFHDYKKVGLPDETLDTWIADLGWETLLNRRGTTWRRLPADRREHLDAATARQIMRENLSIIRRPVIEYPGGRIVGFDEGAYDQTFR
jgi:Spx/MgsR family transcriptional regulator